MSDEAKVRELLAPMRDIPVDLEGRRFKVDRDKVLEAMLSVPVRREGARAARARRTAWALAASFAVASGAFGWVAANRSKPLALAQPMLDIRSVRGEVTHIQGAARSAVSPGTVSPIDAQGELTTAAASEAFVHTPDGLEVQVFENSRMGLSDLRGSQPALALHLTRGAIRCRVPHLAEGRRFSVITPDATVVVHGTTFRVTLEGPTGAMKTCVRVEEGVVGVVGTGGETRLEASQSWGCDEPTADVKNAPSELGTPASRRERRAPSGSSVDPAHSDSTHSERGTLDEENRLFQAGLAAERAGEARRAATSFDLLLSRYPQSPLANEARAALARVAAGTKGSP